MNIRQARASDADAVLAIIHETSTLPQWTREALAVVHQGEPVTRAPLRRLLLGEDGSVVLGFVQLSLVHDEAELELMAVHHGWRRRGVGRELLQSAMQQARRDGASVMYMEVRQGNQAALRMYQAVGAVVTGSRTGYYCDPIEDAVLLRLALPPREPEADGAPVS